MKDAFYKYIGFAETLIKGKNPIPEKTTERTVKRGVQTRCLHLSLFRFNNGGYILNLENHNYR